MGEIYVAATGEPGFQKFCVIKKVIAERTDKGKANRFLDEAKVVLRLVAREPRAHVRRGRARRRVLHRDGARRGQGPARDLEPLRPHADAHPARRRAARRARDRARARVRAQLRRSQARAPRRRAAQHPAVVLRRGEAHRLRARAQRAQAGAHGARRRVRARRLPRARAGARRGRRRAQRHLQPGRRRVGAAHGAPVSAVAEPRRRDGDVARAPPAHPAAVVEGRVDHARARRRHHARARARARGSLPDAPRRCGRRCRDVIARLSPRADAERSAEFLRALCGDAVREEQIEREHLLGESIGLACARTSRTCSRPCAGHRADGARSRRSAPSAGRGRPLDDPVVVEPARGAARAHDAAARRLHGPRHRGPLPHPARPRRGRHGHRLRRRARRDRQGRRA